jgi:hypothetical protein
MNRHTCPVCNQQLELGTIGHACALLKKRIAQKPPTIVRKKVLTDPAKAAQKRTV